MHKQDIIEALEMEKQVLLDKLNSLEVTILTMKQSLNVPLNNDFQNGWKVHQPWIPVDNGTLSDIKVSDGKYRGYSTAKSNKQKVAIILREQGKFLHMRQLVEIAQSLEPRTDPKVIAKSIPQAIYALKNNGTVVNVVVGKSNLNAFWGSKSWLDEEGEVLPEYMYDEGQLSANKSEKIEI